MGLGVASLTEHLSCQGRTGQDCSDISTMWPLVFPPSGRPVERNVNQQAAKTSKAIEWNVQSSPPVKPYFRSFLSKVGREMPNI